MSAEALPARPHVPLVRCRVQFLGRAAPAEVQDGILAIQRPLHQLFCNFAPQDAVITVYTSGIIIEPLGVSNDLWFPIQDLLECAAVRPVGHPPEVFVPLSDSTTPGVSVFAFVFPRRDIPVSDCHAIIARSEEAAMALLRATELAHLNRAGWAAQGDRPPPSRLSIRQSGVQLTATQDWDGAVVKDGFSDQSTADYYQKPPLQGFFYAPNASLIKQYNIDAKGCESTANQLAAAVVAMPIQPPVPAPQLVQIVPAPQQYYPPAEYFLEFSEDAILDPALGGFLQQAQLSPSSQQQQQQQQQQQVIVPETVQPVHCLPRRTPAGTGWTQGQVSRAGWTGGPSCQNPSWATGQTQVRGCGRQAWPAARQASGTGPTAVYCPSTGTQQYAMSGQGVGGPAVTTTYLVQADESSSDSDCKKKNKKNKKKKCGKKCNKKTSPGQAESVVMVRANCPSQQCRSEEQSFEQYLPDQIPVNGAIYSLSQYLAQQGGGGPGSADYLRPVVDPRYESHITPGVAQLSLLDKGPYERRLPTAASLGSGPTAAPMQGMYQLQQQQPAATDPETLNGNFILRPADDYRVYR